MSRSNPTPTTPVARYFEWRGGNGALQHYDRDAGKNIEEKLPFSFIVLDELTTIGGYSDKEGSGIWSNEVRTVKDVLIVKTKSGTLAQGSYETLKDHLKAQGGKFARSVYIAYQRPSGEDFEWVIGNLKLVGAAVGAWFEFRRKCDVYDHGVGVRLKGSTEEKKGSTKFFVPTFEATTLDEADNSAAIALDEELQAYLKTFFARRQDDAMVADEKGADDHVVIDTEDKPIDLSEIPF